MKKLFFFASAAALLATSCSDDLGLKNPYNQEVEGNTSIIASYPIGVEGEVDTRTAVEPTGSGNSVKYVWEQGDAIGVFGQNAYTNAMFSFNTKGQTDQFVGDGDAITGNLTYAYYPWAPGTNMTNGLLSVNFLANQNYNHTAAAAADGWKLNPPSGSFSQGVAPAVAVGPAVSNGKLNMTFNSVGSYLVFPVISYDPITVTDLELTVSAPGNEAGGDPQPLTGVFTVDMNKVTNQGGKLPSAAYTGTGLGFGTDATNNTTIKLNCGEGVALNSTTSNFWFVVPPTLDLSTGTVLTLTVNALNSKGSKVSSTISKTIGNGGPGVIGSNALYQITPETGQPFPFNTSTDTFVIQNLAQFLEYAYLVSNGSDAVDMWNDFIDEGFGAGEYSNLRNMVIWGSNAATAGYDGNHVYMLKNATIVNSITFSKDVLESYFAGMNDVLKQTDYYKEVYGTFIENGSISAIGGGDFTASNPARQYDFTISGANSNITLNNLTINATGNGAFIDGGNLPDASNGTLTGPTISNITFNNLTVNGAQTSATQYILASGTSNVSFSNVNIGAVSYKPKSTPSGYKVALFNTDYSSNYTYYNNSSNTLVYDNDVTGVVSNTSGYALANSLTIDNNSYGKNFNTFYFTFPATGVDAYNAISVKANVNGQGYYGWGSVLTIAGNGNSADAAAALVNKIKNDGDVPYSVVDSNTSYWTGLVATGNGLGQLNSGTAEYFASIVQESASDAPTTFTKKGYNLNLMGSYIDNEDTPIYAYWWNKGNNLTVQGTKNSSGAINYLQISDVFINGTDGKNSTDVTIDGGTYNYLTLLGNNSTVNYLQVNGIQIYPSNGAEGNLVIAAISTSPAASSSYINVGGMEVNLDNIEPWGEAYVMGDVLGGMYYRLTQDNLQPTKNYTPAPTAPLTNVSIEDVTGYSDGYGIGYLAGEMYFDLTTSNQTLTSPYSPTGRKPFGVLNIYVNPSQEYSSSTLVLSNFNYYTQDNITDLINLTASDNIKVGYTVYVQVNGTRYLWEYKNVNPKLTQFVYQGTVQK